MKLSKKEILIIFILAVLATGLSLIFPRMGCFGEYGPGVFCDSLLLGFPRPWLSLEGIISLSGFLFDFLFYLVVFSIGWIILKFVTKKVKK